MEIDRARLRADLDAIAQVVVSALPPIDQMLERLPMLLRRQLKLDSLDLRAQASAISTAVLELPDDDLRIVLTRVSIEAAAIAYTTDDGPASGDVPLTDREREAFAKLAGVLR